MQRYPFYEIKRGTDLGAADTWNKRFQDIDLRLHARELDGAKIDDAVAAITNVALQRLDDTFTPIIADAIDRLSTVGALFVAQSESEHTVGLGEMSFVLTQATRAAYVVTDYVVIRSGSAALIAHVLSYDRANGLLTVDVEAASGAGTFDDWEVRVSAPPDIEHATRTDNPHQTTAAQVGAYTTEEVDTALYDLHAEVSGEIDASATSLTASIGGKLSKGNNLSDLGDVGAARINLDIEAFSPAGKALANGTDLNTLSLKNGIYTGTALANSPSANGCAVFVQNWGTYSYQRLNAHDLNQVWERWYNPTTTTWSAWKKVITEDSVPSRVGEIVIDTTGIDPQDCLLADGSTFSRATFAALWARASANAVSEATWAAGNQGRFSVGDGVTTARLPDLRDVFIRGLPASGRTFGSYQDDAFQGHWHRLTGSSSDQTTGQQTDMRYFNNSGTISNSAVSVAVTDGTNGTPRTAAETRPKNIAYRIFIRYK